MELCLANSYSLGLVLGKRNDIALCDRAALKGAGYLEHLEGASFLHGDLAGNAESLGELLQVTGKLEIEIDYANARDVVGENGIGCCCHFFIFLSKLFC